MGGPLFISSQTVFNKGNLHSRKRQHTDGADILNNGDRHVLTHGPSARTLAEKCNHLPVWHIREEHIAGKGGTGI